MMNRNILESQDTKILLRWVDQVVLVESGNCLLVCWHDGSVSDVRGEDGRKLYGQLEADPNWLPGVNGKRLIRRGCRPELVDVSRLKSGVDQNGHSQGD